MIQTGKPGIHLPMPRRKRGAALLDQQLWCFGRDIWHTAGNALLRQGMRCYRTPPGKSGGHAYVCDLADGLQAVVWGFGVAALRRGVGMAYVSRQRFEPLWTRQDTLALPLWMADQLPAMRPPRRDEDVLSAAGLLTSLFHWLADYEDWVQDRLGAAHREACLKLWHRRVVAPASAMAAAWRDAAGWLGAAATTTLWAGEDTTAITCTSEHIHAG